MSKATFRGRWRSNLLGRVQAGGVWGGRVEEDEEKENLGEADDE